MRGVVPVPEGWESSFRMTFLSFTGNPAAPAVPSTEAWSPLESDRPDRAQMLFADPLDRDQIADLNQSVD